MNLIERIEREMATDTENMEKQSELLAEAYRTADAAGQALLDEAFVCLCGWTLKTLLDRSETDDEGDDDATRCDECGERIPAEPQTGGLENRHHAESCSLYNADKE